uniref:WRKY19-like zinc finger domain-containing protein n=1 Tax=Leersia perrieri TaxID=77586 RepID=A0A0D9VHG4_9ORYZ
MNNSFSDIINRGNQPSGFGLMGHSVPSYTIDSHGQSSSWLDNSSSHGKRGNNRRSSNHGVSAQDDGCGLVLGLGPSPEIGSSARRPKAPSTLFSQSQSFQSFFTEPGMLSLGLNRGDNGSTIQHMEAPAGNIISFSSAAVVDEGSTSARRRSSGGYMPSLLLAPRPSLQSAFEESHDVAEAEHTDHRLHQLSPEPSPSATTMTTEASLVTVAAGATNPAQSQSPAGAARRHPKKCRFKGCSKGARGASGLCIAHGGGQRCQKPGCHKGAESRTAYCKAHGGGRRCMQLGCTKSAEGKTDHCIAHGGGRRCGHHGCPKAARGKSGRCIKHGGGKRCSVEGCIRSAEGRVGLCISHGGGRRCQHPDCRKGAQGSTLYCKAHGGGRRCVFDGCLRGAEGSTPLCKAHGGGKRCMFEGGGLCPKSVHGGTSYCVAHGGGKRCAVDGCTKSARGRTDRCVKHGGGKRCAVEGCDKSAQGSTAFCKAHGGGKRCTWGGESGGCEKFARGRSGLCAAHGTLVASQSQRRSGNGGGSTIGPGLFHGLVTMNSKGCSSASGVSTVSESDCTWRAQELIPPQVLVPNSMKSSCSSAPSSGRGRETGGGLAVPEGRVHGGGLLSLLGGSFRNVDVDKL